jgi:uncharacterized protein (DUF427 family)
VHPSKLQKNELRTESEPGLAVLEEEAVGLSWQQGPLSAGAIGRFLVPEPLPKSLLYVEPLRRRFRVRFGGAWIADSEHALVLFEPGRYPVAYFRESDISSGVLERTEHTTEHPDLGLTSWFTVRTGDYSVPRGAWQHVELPAHAQELQTRVAFAWRAMDAFYEEDERILGHAADSYHRIDIRQTSRHLVVHYDDRVVADTKRPLVPYESGFAPRWYVPRADIDESRLTALDHETFCPYKGLYRYYDIGDAQPGGLVVSSGVYRGRPHLRLRVFRAGCRLCSDRWRAAPPRPRSDGNLAWTRSESHRRRRAFLAKNGERGRQRGATWVDCSR